MLLTVPIGDHNLPAVDRGDHAVDLRGDHLAAVAGHAVLDAGADGGGLGAQQRNGLALHIGAHQGPVGVVVLQEGNQGRRHAHNLHRRNIHQVGLCGRTLGVLVAHPDFDTVVLELVEVVQPRVGLGNLELLLLVGGQPDDRVVRPAVHGGAGHEGPDGNHCARRQGADGVYPIGANGHAFIDDSVAVFRVDHGAGYHTAPEIVRVLGKFPSHHAIGGLDETELVDAGIGGQRTEQADVGAFRRLDGADAAIVREVNVAHVETGPLPGQAAGAQGREAALVGQLGQRVGLVHELGELGAAEEFPNGGNHGADVDQGLGRGVFLLHQGHLFLDHPLHAEQADAHLVLHQLADGADAAVAQVVNVVHLAVAVVDADHLAKDGNDVVAGQYLVAAVIRRAAQVAVELMAPHVAQVVAARLEKQVFNQGAGVVQAGRFAGTEPAIELHLGGGDALGRVLVELLAFAEPPFVPETAQGFLREGPLLGFSRVAA